MSAVNIECGDARSLLDEYFPVVDETTANALKEVITALVPGIEITYSVDDGWSIAEPEGV